MARSFGGIAGFQSLVRVVLNEHLLSVQDRAQRAVFQSLVRVVLNEHWRPRHARHHARAGFNPSFGLC